MWWPWICKSRLSCSREWRRTREPRKPRTPCRACPKPDWRRHLKKSISFLTLNLNKINEKSKKNLRIYWLSIENLHLQINQNTYTWAENYQWSSLNLKKLTWCSRLKLVKEKFEIADDDELSGPALLDAAGFWHFDVAFVGRADAASRINAQRTFSWKRTRIYLNQSRCKQEYAIWTYS